MIQASGSEQWLLQKWTHDPIKSNGYQPWDFLLEPSIVSDGLLSWQDVGLELVEGHFG